MADRIKFSHKKAQKSQRIYYELHKYYEQKIKNNLCSDILISYFVVFEPFCGYQLLFAASLFRFGFQINDELSRTGLVEGFNPAD